ncbi:MAG: hypothetical protein ACI4TH_02145 [Candidatus Ornithomonoglobus sp.]
MLKISACLENHFPRSAAGAVVREAHKRAQHETAVERIIYKQKIPIGL